MKRILIVEDDKALLKILVDKLTAEGFLALQAKNGKDGLDMAVKEHPDLILLDIIMPVMDGISMLKKLRGDERGKDVPVIILTNLSDSKSISDSMNENITNYLVKSDWKLEDIVKIVRERLGITE